MFDVGCSMLALLLLAGCQTVHQFPKPNAQWHNETGQLQYAGASRSLIGEMEVSMVGEREFQLDFSAGPGFPIMRLRESGGLARAEVAFAHISWQGSASRAPGRLKPWIALHEVFSKLAKTNASGRVALQSDTPGFWNADVSLAGRKPKMLTVNFPRSRERFVFHFNR